MITGDSSYDNIEPFNRVFHQLFFIFFLCSSLILTNMVSRVKSKRRD